MTLLVTLAVASALAQEPSASEPAPTVTYKPVTELEFVNQMVTATVDGPNGTTLLVRSAPAHFAPMIQPRLDFDEEMKASTDEIR